MLLPGVSKLDPDLRRLSHSFPLLHFYNPWKYEKTVYVVYGVLMFSGNIEM